MAEESKTVEFLEICTLERKEWSRSLTVMSDAKCYSSNEQVFIICHAGI